MRLVLPRSEQRIRLLFDVDDDDNGEPGSEVRALSENVEDENLALALRFIREANEKLKFNVDVGARRFDSRIQGFARLRASSEDNRPEGWSYKFSNDLRQFYSSGYVNRTRMDFWKSLTDPESAVFRSSTGFEWRRRTDGANITQTVGIYDQPDPKTLLAFEALAAYRTSPDPGDSHYEGHQFRVRYRRNAFRPWFHYEFWPGVAWLTENNMSPKLTALFRVEVGFGQLK